MNLVLDKDINADYVREKVQRRLERTPHSWKTDDEVLIDVYIHEYSNYEKVMWSFWKRSKDYCMKEIESLLMQISNIDKDLVWKCIEVYNRYERTYEQHHFKSQLVKTGGMNMNQSKEVA